jgi:GNAT superfamily N-acetyltransferase
VSDSVWQIVPHDGSHDRSAFDCGEPELNAWLQRHALDAARSGSARIFVAVDQAGRVVGYYAVAAQSVVPRGAPQRLGKGMPRHPIPVVLLARLAVDRGFRGRGLGSGLLKNALLRCLNAAAEVGVRAVIVDAKNADARRFYRHFNFEAFAEDANRLFLLVKDLRRMLSGPS